MAKVTSSRDRSTRQRTKPVTSSARRPSRQRNSNANVTNSESRPSRGTARVTRNQDARRPPSGAGRVDNTNVGPQNTGRSLPGAGGTNANSPRAQNQQAWTRDRGARAQLQRGMTNFARGAARMAGIDRQSVADRKLSDAARGTKGEGVREGRPRPEITRSTRGSATDARIEPVRVREIRNGQGALPSGDRPRLPEGRRGGDPAPSSRGEVARRPAPYPRPGGRVVVDESPRLPEGRRGGDLAKTNSGELARPKRPARLPADSRGSGTRIGNSSQPWGDRPGSTNSPRVSSTRALPPGKPGGPLVSGGARPKPSGNGGGAAEAAGRGLLRGAGTLLGRGAVALETLRTAQKVFNPKDNLITNLQDLGSGIYNATTPKGGARKPYISDNPTARRANERNGFTPDGRRIPRVRPGEAYGPGGRPQRIPVEPPSRPTRQEPSSRPSSSGGGQSGGYTPASRQSPAPAAPSRQSERPTRSSGPEPGSRQWKDFNPGRGTSYTNNPLLRNDAYLMGKIKQREDSLPKGPVADGASYGESLKIEKLRQEEEKKKKQK